MLYKLRDRQCPWIVVNSQPEPGQQWCAELYSRKAAELVLYGRALGLSHGEAEDVLQETFIALMKRETAPENPEHYMLRAYRNRTFNFKRSLWRRLTRELESKKWFEPDPGETEAESRAMKALAKLPPDQREVIVLKIWHEYTFDEIGELLDLSPNTAAGRYRYGLQKLKSRLTNTEYEGFEFLGDSLASVDATPSLSQS